MKGVSERLKLHQRWDYWEVHQSEDTLSTLAKRLSQSHKLKRVKREKRGSFWTLTYSGKTTVQENPGRHVETQTVHKVNNLVGAQTSTHTMPCEVMPLLLHCLLFLSVIGLSQACLEDPASAYRFTGAVCRLTYPAAVVCKWEYLSTLGVCSFSLLSLSHLCPNCSKWEDHESDRSGFPTCPIPQSERRKIPGFCGDN